MNQVPSPQCPHCGRNLSTDDLRGMNCPSCGTALPHHARAAQQVALVNQVLAQHMAAPPPYAMPPTQANPYANPYVAQAMHQANQATKAAATSAAVIGIVVVVAVIAVLLVAGGVVAAVLLR